MYVKKILIVDSYEQQTILCMFLEENTTHAYFYVLTYIHSYIWNMSEKKTWKNSYSDGVNMGENPSSWLGMKSYVKYYSHLPVDDRTKTC